MANPTPGPWRWEVNRKNHRVQLCGGVPQFDLTVMDFVRWGMTSAQPRFLDPADLGPKSLRPMILCRSEMWARPIVGREHHADWMQGIDHPDANLIAAAPDLYAAAKNLSAASDAIWVKISDAEQTLLKRAWDAMDAAIAKAEGKSPLPVVGGE